MSDVRRRVGLARGDNMADDDKNRATLKVPEKCPLCGGRLKYVGGGEYKCISCFRTQMDDYGKVRDYLYKHGNANMQEISGATGVSEELLVELIRSGKIEMRGDSPFKIACEMCGAQISTGRLCEKCRKYIDDIQHYRDSKKSPQQPRIKQGVAARNIQSGRMRYINQDDKR